MPPTWDCVMGEGHIPTLRVKDESRPTWTVSAASPGVTIDIASDDESDD